MFTCVGSPMQLKIYCSNICNISNKFEKKRFTFDLENTLFYISNHHNSNTLESNIIPNIKNIDYLKFLKNIGHEIIIYTSYGMKEYNNNIGLVMKNSSKFIYNLLDKFKIPYDEIYFGKPYTDFYIDNLSINAYDDEIEKKIGIYKTGIKERDFNEINHEKMDIIIKKSNNKKLDGEIYYYQNIPKDLKKYFPLYINNGDNWYSIEKINGITLSYLYVNESLTVDLFKNFLYIIKEIHNYNKIDDQNINNNNLNNKINIYANYLNKIKERYNNYNYSKFIGSELIYEKLICYFTDYENNNKGIKGIIHGDPVFSNILVDNNNNFKLIDMRGIVDDIPTLYGDILYDYGKIYQSLIGYDEILLDKLIKNEYKKRMIEIFENFIKENLGKDYLEIIKIITNSLLFTLIPLHNNEKCNDFYNLIQI
jgi:capsule biosynthesis phosphatase